MQQQERSHSTSQCLVETFVGVNKRIEHVHRRRDWTGRFIDIAVKSQVRVTVDDPGHHEFSGSIDHGCTCWYSDAGADLLNLPVVTQDTPILDYAMRDSEDRSVLDQHVGRRSRRL